MIVCVVNNQIIIWQMSSKHQVKPLLSRNTEVSEYLMFSNTASTFSAYERDLQANINIIIQKFPNHDKKKVQQLLEELDNNYDLALQILEEENAHCNQIITEKRRSIHTQLNLSKEEENRILKQSFLNLYKKLLAKTVELEQLQKKYETQKQQNQKLKRLNRFMIQEEFSQETNNNSPSVCS